MKVSYARGESAVRWRQAVLSHKQTNQYSNTTTSRVATVNRFTTLPSTSTPTSTPTLASAQHAGFRGKPSASCFRPFLFGTHTDTRVVTSHMIPVFDAKVSATRISVVERVAVVARCGWKRQQHGHDEGRNHCRPTARVHHRHRTVSGSFPFRLVRFVSFRSLSLWSCDPAILPMVFVWTY